jgi:hypothetical protein
MNDLEWWAYMHVNGHVQVKRYFHHSDISHAQNSTFCKQTIGPFKAADRDAAVLHANEVLKK